jgi:CDK-activating kinase assembly factor MAT1
MCDNCINRLFLSGPGPCPFCKTTLRRSNFVVQTFEDLLVEKEVQVRKKVGRYFNKRLEDFPNLRAYNDYLEQSEDLIFNLIHNIDVQATNEKIERYRVENKDQIAASLAKQVAEDKALQQQLLREKKEKQLRKEAYLNQAIEEEKSRKHEKLELMNQIVFLNLTRLLQILLQKLSCC